VTLPDPVRLALPAFILLLLVEMFVGRWRGTVKYELRDAAASLAMGMGNLALGVLTGGAVLVAMQWVHQFRLFEIGYQWWAFALIFFAEDFCYYVFHRWSHEVRWLWCAHVNHHSSQHYNLSTALRQTWTGFVAGGWLIWLSLAAIGFPPALIVFQKGVSLVYQFWIHTEAIGRLPAPIEYVFNTPSHHRIHHAVNPRYLDRNYAGILIIWDRMFGTFVPEDKLEPCRYGIVKQLDTFNPLRIAFHEWWAMLRDAARASGIAVRLGFLFAPPGWRPDGNGMTSARIRALDAAARQRQAH
jgi:sterol desaturase/sphingolipid hydroxylase (fatty acid hydroxylase superfamily)